MPVNPNPFQTVDGVGVWFEGLQADTAEYQDYWWLLSEPERQAARRLVRVQHRRRYVVCHGKVRVLLGQRLGLAPERVSFARLDFGKPVLVDAAGRPLPLQFNLSHSGNWMALAAGRCELGIDIEAWDPRHDLELLATECLAATEWAYWRMLPADLRMPAFYRFWTAKESLAKAVGSGIGIGLADIVTQMEGQPGFVSLPACCGNASDWRLRALCLPSGISGAVTLKNTHRV